MAQYGQPPNGDPNNPDLSRFQRYHPETESSSAGSATNGRPANGVGANGVGANGQRAVGSPNQRYGTPPGYSSPGAISAAGHGNGGDAQAGASSPQGQDSYDANWPQRMSSIARKRNQWRQFQTLKPDFGQSAAPVEPPAPSPPPRNASLPTFKSLPHQAAPRSTAPMRPGNTGSSPSPRLGAQAAAGASSAFGATAPQTAAYTSPTMRGNLGSPAAAPQARTVPPLQFRPTSSYRSGASSLQPHPHSTALPEAQGRGRRDHSPQAKPGIKPPARPAAADSPHPPRRTPAANPKVTPLRPPVGSTVSRTQTASQGIAQVPSERPGTASGEGNLHSRSLQKPRRRLGKPPLAMLYLIRLVILGVGVAAIAGTLLSVLSPSNLASSPGQEETQQETTRSGFLGPLVEGTTATLVSDIALGQEITRLQAEVEQLGTLTPGLTQTAFMVDLDTGDYVDIAGSEPISAASTIKVPILVAFLQEVDAGNIALNQGLVLQDTQMAGGSGTMQNDPVGSRYTALEVATQMIITSDNTATNMMIDALGGADVLNQRFRDWGLEATVLRNPLPDLDGTNTTTVKDLSLLLALIDQGGLLTPRSRDRLFSIMQRTVNKSLIPYGVNDDSLTANKTGDINTVLGDVALVDAPNGKRYVVATLIERPDNDGRASELIRRTSEVAHQEFSQPIAPVGGIDPSTPEDAVPAPASPETSEPEMPPIQNQEVAPDREQIPQG